MCKGMSGKMAYGGLHGERLFRSTVSDVWLWVTHADSCHSARNAIADVLRLLLSIMPPRDLTLAQGVSRHQAGTHRVECGLSAARSI